MFEIVFSWLQALILIVPLGLKNYGQGNHLAVLELFPLLFDLSEDEKWQADDNHFIGADDRSLCSDDDQIIRRDKVTRW